MPEDDDSAAIPYQRAGLSEDEIDAVAMLAVSADVAEPFATHVAVPVRAIRRVIAVLDRFVDAAGGAR